MEVDYSKRGFKKSRIMEDVTPNWLLYSIYILLFLLFSSVILVFI